MQTYTFIYVLEGENGDPTLSHLLKFLGGFFFFFYVMLILLKKIVKIQRGFGLCGAEQSYDMIWIKTEIGLPFEGKPV